MRWLALLCVLLCGCVVQMPAKPTTPDTKPDVQPVVVTKTTRADLCQMLAAHVDAGHIDTTDDLVRVLSIMKDAGDWTEADSVAVDAAMPGITAEKRALTKDDSAKLKAVK